MNVNLQFENITIGRNNILIDAVNLKVNAGTLLILTGKNGSGKSTFLKTIAGLIKPLSGVVYCQGKNIHLLTYNERAQLIAYVNTQKNTADYIKVIELVSLGRFPFKDKLNNEEKAMQALEQMGIAHLAYKYINEVSDGELQKANIARALAQNTQVILLDEPSAFLDYPSKKELFIYLKKIAIEQQKIIICPTHDIELSQKAGNLFWHLEDNKLTESNTQEAWL